MYPRLRDLRQDQDLTQKQLAALLKMSQTGYSKYETCLLYTSDAADEL